MRLWRLRAEGKRLITPELVGGELERWPEAQYAGLLEPHERAVTLDALDGVLDRVRARTRRYEPDIDALSAVELHMALPLSRREASDPAVWRFLTVVHRPDFVRHRWENRSWTGMRSRFWSLGTRPDSNALARLWWIAELTRDETNYELTHAVLLRQPLVNNLFVRYWSSYRPAVAAAVQVLSGAPAHEIEACARLLTKALSSVVLESLDTGALIELLQALRSHA